MNAALSNFLWGFVLLSTDRMKTGWIQLNHREFLLSFVNLLNSQHDRMNRVRSLGVSVGLCVANSYLAWPGCTLTSDLTEYSLCTGCWVFQQDMTLNPQLCMNRQISFKQPAGLILSMYVYGFSQLLWEDFVTCPTNLNLWLRVEVSVATLNYYEWWWWEQSQIDVLICQLG